MKVEIMELPDRYLILDSETGEPVEDNLDTGFSYKYAAKEYAESKGWEIVE